MFTTFVMAMVLGKTEQGGALLDKGKRRLPDVAIGAGIGMLVFLLIYGFSTLNVTYDSWIYAGYIEEDTIQHYAGWLWFRASEWSWPPTVAENLSQPYGASIAFTDSIPLVAVIAKIFSPLLPETFQYFGWFNFICFALQGVFAMLLVRGFGFGRLYAGFATVLFVTAPVLVERAFRHDALAAQWMILAALWLYFEGRRRSKTPWLGFWLLCVFSVSIHTYLTPMLYALLAAALADEIVKTHRWLRPALLLGSCFAGTVALAYPVGLLTRGGGGGAEGFGRYSMNLNALINPSSFDWYAEDDRLGWSRILPMRAQNYHQYDGFNYLGFGVILALVALVALVALAVAGLVLLGLALKRQGKAALRPVATFIKGHLPLLFVCLCLAVFALSNKWVWDTTTLFEVSLPGKIMELCAIFRASGRLFWPVWYLLVLIVVVALPRVCAAFAVRLGKGAGAKVAVVAMAAVVALQVFDLSGVFKSKHDYFANGPIEVENEFTSEGWVFLAENYDHFVCLGNLFDYNLAAGIVRYNTDATTNLILTNRGNFAVIEAEYVVDTEYLLDGGEIEPGVLYLCSDEGTFMGILQGVHPDVRGYNTGHYWAFGLPVEGNPLEAYSNPNG